MELEFNNKLCIDMRYYILIVSSVQNHTFFIKKMFY